jgi:hypothetical protein
MTTINDGGPAFPSTIQYFHDDKNANEEQDMTLRDYFAAKAMPQFIDFGTRSDDEYFELSARAAYLMADAMLKAREVKS